MNFDVVIIGGGIVGLATALKTKEIRPDLKICLLEKENDIAKHQTGNNSGVIHSGIYYKPGSLKAQNCLNGYQKLLNFCEEHAISYRLTGKIIVATEKRELPRLEDLFVRGQANGLTKIKKLIKEELLEYEPHVNGIKGIHIPYSGIVDYIQVSHKMSEIFTQKYSGIIRTNQKVQKIEFRNEGAVLFTQNDEFTAKLVVNTAGLYSDKIAKFSMGRPELQIVPFRGEYYTLKPEKEYLVKNLIYPVPDPDFPFLGVHFTHMISGGVEAGPNAVFAFKKEGYKKTDVSVLELWESISWPGFQKVMWKYTGMGLGEYYRSFNKSAFTAALQKLVPEIVKDDLVPGNSGVRAQACDRNGKLIDDFYITETPKAINVLNAPSPAATASLSIGETIAEIIVKRF